LATKEVMAIHDLVLENDAAESIFGNMYQESQ